MKKKIINKQSTKKAPGTKRQVVAKKTKLLATSGSVTVITDITPGYSPGTINIIKTTLLFDNEGKFSGTQYAYAAPITIPK